MSNERWGFEEFQQMEVIRSRGVAEVIVDHFVSVPGDGFEDDDGKPVRLIDFEADACLSDFEVIELAYSHYIDLCEAMSS